MPCWNKFALIFHAMPILLYPHLQRSRGGALSVKTDNPSNGKENNSNNPGSLRSGSKETNNKVKPNQKKTGTNTNIKQKARVNSIERKLIHLGDMQVEL